MKTMEEDIWNNYPQELLDEAEQREQAAEQALLNTVPCDPDCDPDPYNKPLFELLQLWWARRNNGN